MSSSRDRLARKAPVILRPTGALPTASVVAPAGRRLPADHAQASASALASPSPSMSPSMSIEDLLREARRAGHEEGREAGLAEAAASAEATRMAAAARAADMLTATAARVGDQREAVVAELVSDVVTLAFDLLEVLVGREAVLAAAPGRDAVARALALAPEGEDLVVRVHPDSGVDVAEIEELVDDPRVTVVHDADVEATGCLVTVGSCHIDAQIAPALARVRACLASVAGPPPEAIQSGDRS